MDVELDRTRAGGQRRLDGGERVFGSVRRVPAMSNDLDIAQMAHSSQLGPVIWAGCSVGAASFRSKSAVSTSLMTFGSTASVANGNPGPGRGVLTASAEWMGSGGLAQGVMRPTCPLNPMSGGRVAHHPLGAVVPSHLV